MDAALSERIIENIDGVSGEGTGAEPTNVTAEELSGQAQEIDSLIVTF